MPMPAGCKCDPFEFSIAISGIADSGVPCGGGTPGDVPCADFNATYIVNFICDYGFVWSEGNCGGSLPADLMPFLGAQTCYSHTYVSASICGYELFLSAFIVGPVGGQYAVVFTFILTGMTIIGWKLLGHKPAISDFPMTFSNIVKCFTFGPGTFGDYCNWDSFACTIALV